MGPNLSRGVGRWHRPSAIRRVALIGYWFPPLSGGGTARTLAFAKYLPEHGYSPIVVTTEPRAERLEREFRRDDAMGATLAASDCEVLRVADPEPVRLRKRLERWRVFPLVWALAYRWFREPQVFWAKAAARALDREIGRTPVSLIYASAWPTASLEAAAWVASRHGLPWVADLRDLWTRDTLKFYPSKFHYWWESRLERRLLRSAAAVIANTPSAADRLREWLGPEAAGRVAVIPNGYDPEEFDPSSSPTSPFRRGQPITIVHAGTLYAPGELRSRPGRFRPHALDYTARSPIPVANALVRLRQHDPETARRIRVRLLGYAPQGAQRAVRQLGLADQIRFEGCVPRAEAQSAIREADALLVVQVGFADASRRVPYVPGKVYDYLAAGAPILAPVPSGDLLDLLADAPQAYVSGCHDTSQTAEQLRRLADDLDRAAVGRCDARWLAQFDRRSLAGQLARIFDSVADHPHGNAVDRDERRGGTQARVAL